MKAGAKGAFPVRAGWGIFHQVEHVLDDFSTGSRVNLAAVGGEVEGGLAQSPRTRVGAPRRCESLRRLNRRGTLRAFVSAGS